MKQRSTQYLALLVLFFYGLLPAPAWAQVLKGTFAAGAYHSLAIHADGTLWATGQNTYGQLGDGTTTSRAAWVQVGTATNWVQVSAGLSHSLALRTDGTLYSWGSNALGQLGLPAGSGSPPGYLVPTALAGTWTQVSAGQNHSLALKADGTLWAWGTNQYGQLGNPTNAGTTTPNPTPAPVAGTYVQAAAGYDHSLALRADGSLYAWGSNLYAQLGNTTNLTTTAPNPTPALVAGTYTQVAAGGGHSLGLRADGTLWAWGVNTGGQLGTGAATGVLTPYPTPAQVAGTYTRIAAAASYSFGLGAEGTLYAWGGHAYGALGLPIIASPYPFYSTPTALPGTWVQMAGGLSHALGLKADGTLWAWGGNQDGQLGTSTNLGTNTPNPTPTATGTALPTRSTASSLYAGYAIRGDGTLWCWGGNDSGQLGDGTTTDRLYPGQLGTDHDWVQVEAGNKFGVARKANGTVWSWGTNLGGAPGGSSGTSLLVPTQASVPPTVSLAAGYGHILALTATGVAYAWGSDILGEAGAGTTQVLGRPPTAVVGGLTLTQVAAGRNYSLGLTATGTLYAWGNNLYGQLGIVAGSNTGVPNPTPALVPGLAGLVAVVAGEQHALGLTATGTMYAWGYNLYGQLGNTGVGGNLPYNATPTLITGLAGLRQVGAYAQHSLALLANGTIYSWGFNQWGELGQGTFSTTPVTVPAQEATLSTSWAQLGTGSTTDASLVRTASGLSFASAGLNSFGQLGDNTTTNWPRFDRMRPLTAAQPLPVLAATAGAAFSLAPNPARTQATAVGLPTGSTLAVYDAVGRLVVTSTSLSFSVAGLPAGLYLVRATVPGQPAQTTRLVVE